MKITPRIAGRIWRNAPTDPGTLNFLTPEELAAYEATQENQRRDDGIYFIKAGDAIKIGYSITVTDRLIALQTGNHEPIQLLGLLHLEQRDELQIHRRFKHLHLHHEWFRDDPEIRLFILEHEARRP